MKDKRNQIAALLAKANAKGVTQEESEAFTKKAVKLMNKYQIEEAELRDIDPGAQAKAKIAARVYWIHNKANRADYRKQAVVNVAMAYGSKCVQLKMNDGTIRLTILATEGILEMLDILIPSLLEQIEYHVNKASRAYVKEITEMGFPRSDAYKRAVGFRNDFTQYYGVGVAEMIEAAQNAEAAAAGALVLVGDRQRIEEEFKQRYSNAKKLKKRTRYVNPAGATQGFQAGKKANLVGVRQL